MYLTKNFTKEEATCRCGCGFVVVVMDLILPLQDARDIAGIPFPIESWCRCQKRNAVVGGKKDSSHLDGWAVDIKLTWAPGRTRDNTRWIIIDALMQVGFNRFGIAETFIHTDRDPRKPAERIWCYP